MHSISFAIKQVLQKGLRTPGPGSRSAAVVGLHDRRAGRCYALSAVITPSLAATTLYTALLLRSTLLSADRG